eukprot:TRINITY_DN6964_c0_g1_i1.p1 TRINITY_DN6964_c0_g1~~TRINITY_DN6964_c0_g1_i1.p1  ORF type:complete len:329 (-),score=83.77 TRINITY_DN6964_c0_g1_i1:152-1003(-)
MREVLARAGRRALGGGTAGAIAMFVQVTSLMWMRTTMNYQYRHGGTTIAAWKHLYGEGGIRRFYRGYSAAILQGPLSRFGDTAAQAGAMSLLDSYESTKDLPIYIKTLAASFSAAMWRINLMPIDTTKTIMQVEGKDGFRLLRAKVKKSGPTALYQGALGASAGSFVGHYPWFVTSGYLNANLPKAPEDNMWLKLARNAVMGFGSSLVSDTVSNSIRVVKTTKQTYTTAITYPNVVREIIQKDGLIGLFGRGLKTRLLANGMQGIMFTVIWRGLEERWNKDRA